MQTLPVKLSRAASDRWLQSVARQARGAFTLVEMLVVMTIIILLLALAVPAFNLLRGSNDFSYEVGGIAGIFEQARAYAVANNTYVYVGIGEFDVTQSTTASGQTSGHGRLAMCAAATRDGTRGYNVNNPDWITNYTSSNSGSAVVANLTALDKLHFFDNLHLADFSALPSPAPGSKMSRPIVLPAYSLGSTDTTYAVQTPIAWPLGSALSGPYQYLFNKVVQFDPQGVARLQFVANGDSIAPKMEAALQPTHGSIAPLPPADQNVGNQAAVQIDGTTGAVRFFRP